MSKSEQPDLFEYNDNKETVLSQKKDDSVKQNKNDLNGGMSEFVDNLPSKDDSVKSVEHTKDPDNQNQTSKKQEKLDLGDSNVDTQNQGSVNLGKFKDVNSLLKAYSVLEQEFTKKCQKLSEFESDNSKEPQTSSLEHKLEEFVAKFDASDFKTKLRETMNEFDEKSFSSENMYENYVKLLREKVRSAEDFVNDKQFLNDYVFSNKSIKDSIIREYLSNLASITPVQVSVNKNSAVCITPEKKPASISEAGVIAKSIIKHY